MYFRCDCSSLELDSYRHTIEILAFDLECKVNTKTWEMLFVGFQNLKEITIPNIPSGFIPLLVKNKRFLKVLEVGQISNKLVDIICSYCEKTLISFTFDGSQLTYSGVVSLFTCKETLQELRIRNPQYLTKYSISMLATNLVNLR